MSRTADSVPFPGGSSLDLLTPRRSLSRRRWFFPVAFALLAWVWCPPGIGQGAASTDPPGLVEQLLPLDEVPATTAGSVTLPPRPETSIEGEGEHGGELHGGASHSVVAPLLAALIVVIFLAKVGGELFYRLSMPPVLGELTVGVLLGNIALISGWHGLDFLHAPEVGGTGGPYDPGAALKLLAEIGVILLLFEVGLESKVDDMMRVGASSLIAAILGVIAPILLGFGIGAVLLSEESWQVHLFLGATLCATSVGITARVLKDLGRSQQREARIILGAAVIDDVLGLLVLAVVSGIIKKGTDFHAMSLLWEIDRHGNGSPGILILAVGFLVAAVVLGSRFFTRPLFRAATYLHGHGLLVATGLVICFGMAYAASLVQLAPIVGAFAAGMILEHAHYESLSDREKWSLERAMSPLTAVFVPVFFVQMGVEVNLASFLNPAVWGLAAAITVAAIVGKLVCSLGVLESGLDRLSVGLGMVPRGEVGLIFAAAGKALRGTDGEAIIDDNTYSAIIVMVILTTMVTPPLLKWSMTRAHSPSDPAPEEVASEPCGLSGH